LNWHQRAGYHGMQPLGGYDIKSHVAEEISNRDRMTPDQRGIFNKLLGRSSVPTPGASRLDASSGGSAWTRQDLENYFDPDQEGGYGKARGGYDDDATLSNPMGPDFQAGQAMAPSLANAGSAAGRVAGVLPQAVKGAILDPPAKDVEASVPYPGRSLADTAAPLYRAINRVGGRASTPGRSLPGMFVNDGGGYVSAEQRHHMPASDFGIPEEEAYPIMDRTHAANALSRVSQHGTPAQKKKVRAAVHRKYPTMGATLNCRSQPRAINLPVPIFQ
jgi:hypothetical protein